MVVLTLFIVSLFVVVVYLTLTDPLRMQPRGHKIDGTKPNQTENRR